MKKLLMSVLLPFSLYGEILYVLTDDLVDYEIPVIHSGIYNSYLDKWFYPELTAGRTALPLEYCGNSFNAINTQNNIPLVSSITNEQFMYMVGNVSCETFNNTYPDVSTNFESKAKLYNNRKATKIIEDGSIIGYSIDEIIGDNHWAVPIDYKNIMNVDTQPVSLDDTLNTAYFEKKKTVTTFEDGSYHVPITDISNPDGSGSNSSKTYTKDHILSEENSHEYSADGSYKVNTKHFNELGINTGRTEITGSSIADGGIHVTKEYDMYDKLVTTDGNCEDGAPQLELTGGIKTCDRTCAQVKYYTDLTGHCSAPNCVITPPVGWIQTDDMQLCINFPIDQFSASTSLQNNEYCPDTCLLKPIVIKNPDTEDDYYDIGDYPFNYNDYLSDKEDLDNLDIGDYTGNYNTGGSDGSFFDEDTINDYINDNGLPPFLDNNSTGTGNLPDGGTGTETNNGTGTGNLGDLPDGGTGTGGNSLSDDLQNLGKDVRDNSDATKNNTTGLTGLTDILSKMLDSNSTEETTIDFAQDGLDSVVQKYANLDLGGNSGCSSIEPITFQLSDGKTRTLLSQQFLNTLPLDIFKGLMIFSFTLSGVVLVLRQS